MGLKLKSMAGMSFCRCLRGIDLKLIARDEFVRI